MAHTYRFDLVNFSVWNRSGADISLSGLAMITGAGDRPVKGAGLRPRAALALGRPARRLGDGYQRNGV